MRKPLITIITPTARRGGVDIWKTSLQRQTFQEFEALLIDERYGERGMDVAAYFSGDDRLAHYPAPPKNKKMFWNLSRSLNYGLMLARGELIVFYQDYIWLPPEALEKFWQRYLEIGPALISGVGHKSIQPEWAINLEGRLSIFTRSGYPTKDGDDDHPEHATQVPQGVWFRDPRIQEKGLHLCNPIEWEGNWACCARKVANDIGGFDEAFDAGWGYDNVNFAERAQLAGYPIWLDESNSCIGFCHERLFHEEKYKQQAPNNMKLWEKKIERLQRGLDPFRVDCLGALWAKHEALV